MSYTLDDYQVKFINDCRDAVHHYQKVIGCMATGGGKSKCFIDIAKRSQARGKTVLVMTESASIYEQICAELPSTFNIDPSCEEIYIQPGGIYIAMAQTLNRRKELIKQLCALGKDLMVIVDEAHIGTFNAILTELVFAFIIGFTATPDARWAKHLPIFYRGIVIGPQPEYLIQLGKLCPVRVFARVGADLNSLQMQGGDFSEASQELAFGTSKVYDGLIEDLRKIKYRKAIVFTASVKDCNSVYRQLSGAGFKCSIVHRKNKDFPMSDEKLAYNIGQFKDGDNDICIAVGMMTKGFDYSKIDLVVLRRATTSLPLFLQMIGRGSRRRGEEDWKHFFTVLDYGGNHMRHGMWDSERDWKDLWNKPRKPKDGVAPIKVCPQCEYITNASAITCPNCGYQYVANDTPLEYGKLVEITERYRQMVGKKASQLEANELAIYARLKNKKNFAARIAKARDQEKPGYLERYAVEMEYKPGWVDFQRRSIPSGEKISYPDFTLV